MATIAEQSDVEVVGEVEAPANLTELVDEVRPDVLIVALEGNALEDKQRRSSECGFLLGRYPQMRVLALAPEHNRAVFYWAIVDIRSRPVESSEAGILSALREAAAVVGAPTN